MLIVRMIVRIVLYVRCEEVLEMLQVPHVRLKVQASVEPGTATRC